MLVFGDMEMDGWVRFVRFARCSVKANMCPMAEFGKASGAIEP